jgi:hypothetical protein
MRKMILCLSGLCAVPLVYAATSVVGSASVLLSSERTVDINRKSKGDRIASQAQNNPPVHQIVTVEVVGLEQAAVIYRDRNGQVLFASDPVANTTVVVRGVSLPAVTVRATPGATVRPLVLEHPSPRTATHPQPASKEPALLDGCEPAASPLSPSGASAIKARCVS